MTDDRTDRPTQHGLDFARLAAQFEALRQLPEAQRGSALRALEASEPGLAAELRRLLVQHTDDPDELGSPDRAFGGAEIAAAIDEAESESGIEARPLQSIGTYRVVQELGRGGMGTVYLCEREGADFQNRVAIKVLRGDSTDPDQRRRFRTERRILATLRHPNIAALMDGGTTEAGQPYVVMEYVDGPDLLTWCRENDLGIAARLRLFVKVCHAVAHAHRALVVHRDLKPSNILVSEDGEPKLLDFGIAKLLQENLDPSASIARTRTGNMLLTPEYSSPEQVRGDPITTATDVYALGVLLYELLCGQRAQPLDSRSLTQLIEVVCERSAPPPSAVSTEHARALRGDLDTIVARAMSKEPERRYASASAMAEDIERHLAGLPVTARGDTLTYRTRVFVRRHRLALAAATLVFGLAIAFAITTALQNATIARERDEAIHQRNVADEQRGIADAERHAAEQQRAIAEQQRVLADEQREIADAERIAAEEQRAIADEVSEFLVGLFEMATPDPERAETLRARELLDVGARRVSKEIGSPARRAQLQLTMGRAYASLGLYREAIELIDAAEQTCAELAPDTAGHRAAQYWSGIVSLQLGERDLGERRIRTAMQPKADGTPIPESLRRLCLRSLYEHYRDAGRFDEAEALLDELDSFNADPSIDPVERQVAAIDRALLLRDRGDMAGALGLLEDTRVRAIAEGRIDQPISAQLFVEIGRTHKELGNFDEARAALARGLELTERYAGEGHPDVDTLLFSLAMLEHGVGEYEHAEELLRELLEHDEQRFGTEHSYPSTTKAQLAMVVGIQGRAQEAAELFAEALEVQRRVLPAGHPELPTTLHNFGTLLQRNRELDPAARLIGESLALRLEIFDPDHPLVQSTRNSVAVIELDRGNFEAAVPELRAVLEARRRTLGEHSETAGSLLSLGTAYMRMQRYDEAVPLLEESADMFARTLPEGHPTQARPVQALALTHERAGRPEMAIPLFRQTVAIQTRALGDRSFETCYSEWALARCLVGTGETDEAHAILRDLEPRMSGFLEGHRMLDDVRAALAQLDKR